MVSHVYFRGMADEEGLCLTTNHTPWEERKGGEELDLLEGWDVVLN